MVEPTDENAKPEQPNFSGDRDDAIQELLDALPVISKTAFYLAPVEIERAKLKPIDGYQTIFNTRALGATITDPKMEVASAILRKPIAVFRDFLKTEDSRESTVLEYYFGRVRLNTGKESFALVFVRRNVIAKILVSAVAEDLVGLINGLQFYKAY